MRTNREDIRSLRMAEPAEMVGRWTISRGGQRCSVSFGIARLEAANAHAIDDGGACLAALLGKQVAGWRPAPDGVEIAGPDRLTLVLFADQGDGTGRAVVGSEPATLVRAAD